MCSGDVVQLRSVKWNVLYFKGRRGSTSELGDVVRRMEGFSDVCVEELESENVLVE